MKIDPATHGRHAAMSKEQAASDRGRIVQARFASGHAERMRVTLQATGGQLPGAGAVA